MLNRGKGQRYIRCGRRPIKCIPSLDEAGHRKSREACGQANDGYRIAYERQRGDGYSDGAGRSLHGSSGDLGNGTPHSKILIGGHGYYGGYERLPGKVWILAASLREAGVRLLRFKTGTPSRVDFKTLDTSAKMIRRDGDTEGHCFSFFRGKIGSHTCCWLTLPRTKRHALIRRICTERRCTPAKWKVSGRAIARPLNSVTLADKNRHQLFVEPEGGRYDEMYVQGMSTSLPMDVQRLLRTISGGTCGNYAPGICYRYGYHSIRCS